MAYPGSTYKEMTRNEFAIRIKEGLLLAMCDKDNYDRAE
jgi:hypothetical protein